MARRAKGGKYRVGVEVIKTSDRGYGVRSNRCFKANQIIMEYAGEIITDEECERRMNEVYKNNDVSYYAETNVAVPDIKLTYKTVLLSHELRSEHDYRCYHWKYCSIRQPQLQS